MAGEAPTSEEKRACEECLAKGKALLKSGDVEGGVCTLSEALEIKIENLQSAELHPELGEYYLEYGNALLKRAEMSSDFFKDSQIEVEPQASATTAQPSSPCSTTPSPNPEEAEVVSDEQLAWEVLEMARICFDQQLGITDYAKASSSSSSSSPMPSFVTTERELKTISENLAFVHLRLGDLLIIEENFATAAEEFLKSREILRQFKHPYWRTISATIALAQALLFEGRASASLVEFEHALQLIEAYLGEKGENAIPAERLQDFEATKEDLKIQVEEVTRNIKEGVYNEGDSESVKKSFLKKTGAPVTEYGQNAFDKPQLSNEGEEPSVVKIGVVKREYPQKDQPSTERKRHRIDLQAKQNE